MTRLEGVQPTTSIARILRGRVVTVVYEATGDDRAKFLRATVARGIHTQGVERNWFLRDAAPFLVTGLVNPDPQEIKS
jgi:hypothetical protein